MSPIPRQRSTLKISRFIPRLDRPSWTTRPQAHSRQRRCGADSRRVLRIRSQASGNRTNTFRSGFRVKLPDTSECTPQHSISSLSKEQQNWIARADTFFIATHHPTAGTMYRIAGGMPGFVQARGPNDLEWEIIPATTCSKLWGISPSIRKPPDSSLSTSMAAILYSYRAKSKPYGSENTGKNFLGRIAFAISHPSGNRNPSCLLAGAGNFWSILQ